MAAPRRRLTFTSKALAPSGSRIEKPRSPAARTTPEWCLEYQRRIEAARREYLLLKEQEEPEEALEGQGEIQMLEASPDLVQDQLSELAQQIAHVIEACNHEKDLIKEDFVSVGNGIKIMESRLLTEKKRIDSEVQGVGSVMNYQQAVLGELRSSIHVLQNQDNQIVGEATDMFVGIKAELEAQNKKVMDIGLQNFANKVAVQAVQKTVGVLSKRVDEVTTVLATVTDRIKDMPSKRELRQFQAMMEDSANQLAEANTGLTTAMDQYKFSESTPVGIQQTTAGPSGSQPFIHPQRAQAFYSSASSLGDTASEYSWQGIIRGGAGNEAAGNDAAGSNAAEGGDPSPPDPPPSDHGGHPERRPSRRQRRIKDLESSKPIKIKEPKKFLGKPGEDFDTWWVLVQVYIKDQPERFPEDERTIDWIGSLMDSYAASWHIQWLKGTLSGLHPKSMTGYVNALKLRFEDRDAKDEAYAALEKVRYDGCIRDMFTQIQTLNDKAAVTGAAFKKLILERLPHKILEQMHTVDLTRRTDQEIMTIITNAGRTAEKWEAARNNLGLKSQFKVKEKALSRFRRNEEKDYSKREKKSRKSERTNKKKFQENRPERDNTKTEGIDSSELQRRKAAGECIRCAWPSDRKGNHRVADCLRPTKLDKGTASLPKAKEYQKMRVAGLQLESDSEESSSDDSESENSEEGSSGEDESEEEQSEGDYLDDEYEQQEEKEEKNWWESSSDSE